MANTDLNSASLTPNVDTEVGKYVLETGLATRPEVEHCRDLQASDSNQRSLADLLVANGFITANQAKRVRKQVDERKSSQIPGYALMGKLGKGAMATVYKARQLSLDRIVAIKVLPRRMSDNTEFVDRFYKEGRAAAKLSHNNIVQAIDVASTPDGYHYFVMEYVEGQTLYDVMQPPPLGQGRNFTEAEALQVGLQMSDALAHAHRRGLVHRDVKPKNIILTPQNIAKLTDLGLAREVEDKQAAESEAGKAYGTPYYISPEQIRGDVDIDFRADIYSLGATLYHLVTGRPPFEGDSPSAVMHKHLREPLTPPDHIVTDLSASFSEIIEVAMAKDRDERYTSTEAMFEDFQLVKDGHLPKHARRAVDLESIARMEQTAQTIDYDGQLSRSPFSNPAVIWVAVAAGISVIVNLLLLVRMSGK